MRKTGSRIPKTNQKIVFVCFIIFFPKSNSLCTPHTRVILGQLHPYSLGMHLKWNFRELTLGKLGNFHYVQSLITSHFFQVSVDTT